MVRANADHLDGKAWNSTSFVERRVPTALAATKRGVWVASSSARTKAPGSAEIQRIELGSGKFSAQATAIGRDGVFGISHDNDHLWLSAGNANGARGVTGAELVEVDAQTGELGWAIETGSILPVSAARTGTTLWVVQTKTGTKGFTASKLVRYRLSER